jgi:nucleoside-diphosphate-sugar epimerase
MKNILIIGGSYFAGRVFVEELVKEQDVSITVFNRGRFPLNIEGVTELVGDREDISQIRQVIPNISWDTVVDFCAYSPEHIENFIHNVPGHIKHYIFISTTTVYQTNSGIPIMEDAPKLDSPQDDLGSYADYGYQKWLAECALAKECKQKGIAHTSLRPAIVYGPYNYAPRESFFFDLLIDKKPIVIPEDESALFNFIYVIDMARIIIQCMGNERVYNQAFNLASDEIISYPIIIDVLSKITGKELEAEKISMADIENKGIQLPFPLNEQLVYCGDIIRNIFEFEYTPFTNGMHEALKYYLMVKKAEKEKGSLK